MLLGDDYPLLLASVRPGESERLLLNPDNLQLTTTNGSTVSRWTVNAQGVTRIDDWTVTALEVTPLLRRIIVSGDGAARRVGLTLNISHPRFTDLRIKLIAPSGRAVQIDPGIERSSSAERIRIPAAQLSALVGEQLILPRRERGGGCDFDLDVGDRPRRRAALPLQLDEVHQPR